MDCACIHIDAEGSVDCQTTKMVKARTLHACHECKIVIHPGDTYELDKGLWEGAWYTSKTCLDCLSIRNVFFCGGWIYGEVIYRLKEHIAESEGQVSSGCILELTKGARERVFKIIEEVWAYKSKAEDAWEIK